jgi:hypothetical protein
VKAGVRIPSVRVAFSSQVGNISLSKRDYEFVGVIKGIYAWPGNIPEAYAYRFWYSDNEVVPLAVFRRRLVIPS